MEVVTELGMMVGVSSVRQLDCPHSEVKDDASLDLSWGCLSMSPPPLVVTTAESWGHLIRVERDEGLVRVAEGNDWDDQKVSENYWKWEPQIDLFVFF